MGKFIKGAIAGGIGAAVVMSATAAIAGTGVGGLFNLGQTNKVNETSVLSGTKDGSLLHVGNGSAGASATGVSVFTPPGTPPFIVNSSSVNSRLNADRVDSYHADELSRVQQGVSFPGGSAADLHTQATVTVTAPKDGFVEVTGTAFVSVDGLCSPCYAHALLREPSSGLGSGPLIDELDPTHTTASQSVTWLFPAAAGDHTYLLLGGGYPQTGFVVENPTIVAHWIPFDGSGGTGSVPTLTARAKAKQAEGKPRADGSIPSR